MKNDSMIDKIYDCVITTSVEIIFPEKSRLSLVEIKSSEDDSS